MKKLSQTLVLLFLLSSANVFCKNSISETSVSDTISKLNDINGKFEIGIGIEVSDIEIEKVKVNYIKCFPINTNLSWGIGTGFHLYHPEYFLIPLYANFNANLFADKTTPYLSVNAGYYLINNSSNQGFFCNPTVGMSFKTKKMKSLDIGIGYDTSFEKDFHFSSFRDFLVDIRDNGLISLNFGMSF